MVGLKSSVRRHPAHLMPAAEVSSYHDLSNAEQSFRMSKTDLRARPMCHRTRDAIEAPHHENLRHFANDSTQVEPLCPYVNDG